jgi:hypothetical protein
MSRLTKQIRGSFDVIGLVGAAVIFVGFVALMALH